jgi:hypothetical protein
MEHFTAESDDSFDAEEVDEDEHDRVDFDGCYDMGDDLYGSVYGK